MQTRQPSQTAQRAALRRAAHQLLDGPDLVLEDPLALAFAGVEDPERYQANLRRGQNDSFRRLRAFLVARSRFMEDHLRAALDRGVRQYVLLGAGLDTSPYRLSFPTGTRIFEVDHPATQNWKRARVRTAGVGIPEGLRYVPMDFERQALMTTLEDADFEPRRPAFVAWLGVTVYLSRAAVFRTLEALADCAPGSELALDYTGEGQRLSAGAQAAWNAMRGRMARIGEPWLSFFVPAELTEELRRRGFVVQEDLDSAGINERYFARRADGLHTEGLGHLLHARRYAAGN
jgi:methyltransferase (TIGR00027 family)